MIWSWGMRRRSRKGRWRMSIRRW
jgi:hypothetical protein